MSLGIPPKTSTATVTTRESDHDNLMSTPVDAMVPTPSFNAVVNGLGDGAMPNVQSGVYVVTLISNEHVVIPIHG